MRYVTPLQCRYLGPGWRGPGGGAARLLAEQPERVCFGRVRDLEKSGSKDVAGQFSAAVSTAGDGLGKLGAGAELIPSPG